MYITFLSTFVKWKPEPQMVTVGKGTFYKISICNCSGWEILWWHGKPCQLEEQCSSKWSTQAHRSIPESSGWSDRQPAPEMLKSPVISFSKSSSSRYWNVYRKPEYPVNDGYCWIEDIADSMNSCSGGKVLSCLHEWRLFAPHPLNAKTCVISLQGQWKLYVFLKILTVFNSFKWIHSLRDYTLIQYKACKMPISHSVGG